MAKTLIDWIEALTVTGKPIYEGTESAKEYPEFAINRGIAQSIDTVLFAAEMNKRPGVKGRMHFAFLMHSVKKKKRYGKWAKKVDEKTEALTSVQEHFGFSTDKALQALAILSPEQIEAIKNKQMGGVKNGKKSG